MFMGQMASPKSFPALGKVPPVFNEEMYIRVSANDALVHLLRTS